MANDGVGRVRRVLDQQRLAGRAVVAEAGDTGDVDDVDEVSEGTMVFWPGLDSKRETPRFQKPTMWWKVG